MSDHPRTISREVETGDATLRVEVKIDETQLTVSVTASVELAFCVRILGRQHCIEARQRTSTLLVRIERADSCTAYLEKPAHSVEIPLAEVLPALRNMGLPLLWPEAEAAIEAFISRCGPRCS